MDIDSARAPAAPEEDPAFRAVGTDRTIAAIRQVLEDQPLPMPKD